VYVGFLGRTIEIHWSYHAILMFCIWMILVPVCIITIRFFKPKPEGIGITEKVSITNVRWLWFSVHKYGMYTAMFLTLSGALVAVIVSKGISGSVHSLFGVLTVAMGCLQVISAVLRGTHGGKHYGDAKLDDPSTWRGDHYDHSIRRQRFEAYHKTSGYFTSFFAVGAVASGLMQYPMPLLTVLAFAIPILLLIVWIVFEYQGRVHDGYRAVYGSSMEHPFNEARKDL
jgi:hypothetical protein